MKGNIFYIATLFFSLGLGGCGQLQVEKYENSPRLYFFNGKEADSFAQKDSTVHSFFILPDDQFLDTVYVDIRVMGFPTDYPRPVKIVQTNAGGPDAAVPGKHYVAFDSEEMQKNMVMPAGSIRCLFPVIVKRDPSLELSRVRLEMAVVENDYFKMGIDKQLKFIVTTTAQAQKPALWDSYWKYGYGAFGAKKMWFLIHYVGIKDFSNYINDNGYKMYLEARAVEALKEYNADENNPDLPLHEADGTPVTFN